MKMRKDSVVSGCGLLLLAGCSDGESTHHPADTDVGSVRQPVTLATCPPPKPAPAVYLQDAIAFRDKLAELRAELVGAGSPSVEDPELTAVFDSVQRLLSRDNFEYGLASDLDVVSDFVDIHAGTLDASW